MSLLPPSDSRTSHQSDCCGARDSQQDSAGSRGRKTRGSFLLGGSALILLAIIFWRPLQQRCLAYFLLRSEAPSEEVLSGAVEQASDPASLLTHLWRTQRIPHRQFVLSYLNRVSTSKPDLFRAMEPVVLEATGDADIAARESAFATLARMKHPRLRPLALEQLSDGDPAARLIGLQNLRSIAASNDVPIAMRLLNDPEPRVVVAAALVLRQATGQDFGIKSFHATPQFTCIETNPPPAPNLPAIRQGVQRWQAWWTSHQAEFPTPIATPVPHGHAARLVTADFILEDSAGKPIQLSQFRGKTVLLSFWSLGAPASLDDVPALKALQQRNPGRSAVLGLCIPAAPSCCADEREQGHDHAHHHHDDSAAGGTGTEHMRCFVQNAATHLKINYPMLLDTKGSIARRFSIEDLPAYVLIDAEGKVRRRLVGFRTDPALAAIVEEGAGSGPVAAKLPLSANQH
jgi:peroxiredoxin